MADFCKECSENLFGEDFGDLAGVAKCGEKALVICACCGPCYVDNLGVKVEAPQQHDVEDVFASGNGTRGRV